MDKIVKLLWQRDEQALNFLQEEYGSLCKQIISSLLCNVQDAEEVLNDVWLKVWNSIPPARPKYLRAYVAKITRNTALHYIEYNQAQKRSAITVLLDELAECIPDPEWERTMEGSTLREILNEFVHSLHGEERSIFLRRYWFGENIQELAEAYGCSENKVSVMLFRTRKKLRVFLEREGYRV